MLGEHLNEKVLLLNYSDCINKTLTKYTNHVVKCRTIAQNYCRCYVFDGNLCFRKYFYFYFKFRNEPKKAYRFCLDVFTFEEHRASGRGYNEWLAAKIIQTVKVLTDNIEYVLNECENGFVKNPHYRTILS